MPKRQEHGPGLLPVMWHGRPRPRPSLTRLNAVLASIREGKPDFRVRERKRLGKAGSAQGIWSCATYTWGGSDAPRHGAVAVALRPAGGGLRAWVVHATRAGEGALEDALALLSAAAR